MKIVNEGKKVTPIKREETNVGELYAIIDGDGIWFRCQGGFANMSSGAFTNYGGCREDACWVHLPNAELHLNN